MKDQITGVNNKRNYKSFDEAMNCFKETQEHEWPDGIWREIFCYSQANKGTIKLHEVGECPHNQTSW